MPFSDNSLNAIKILANFLIAIDPTCHRQKKIPSISFSGIQVIDENFNDIQRFNSSVGTREGGDEVEEQDGK